MEDRARGDRDLRAQPPAKRAAVRAPPPLVGTEKRADEPTGPAQPLEVGQARCIIGEPLHERSARAGVVKPRPRMRDLSGCHDMGNSLYPKG